MKKVLVVITTGFVSWGGLTTVFMNYYRAMDKSSLQIDVASIGSAEETLEKELQDNAGRYYALPTKQKHPVQYAWELNAICSGYDVMHVHGNSATMALELFIAKMHGIDVRIAHSHNTQGQHPVIQCLLKPFFNNLFTQGLACSKAAGEWLYTKDFEILNNAIDTEKYAYNEESRKKIRADLKVEDRFVIGHVGKFVAAKNHTFILNCFKMIHDRYPNSYLLLIGDGIDKPKILETIRQLHLENDVYLTGMVTDTEEYYCAMDCFVLPSLYEGLCLALIEAQTTGLYCFASDTVPIESKVSDHICYISIDDTLIEWSERVLKHTEDNRVELSRLAQISVGEAGYDIATEANKLTRIYIG